MSLRMRSCLALMLAGSLWLAACQPYQFKATVLNSPKLLSDFRLNKASGGEFRLSADKQKLWLLYFGYTHCPDVCPATLAQIKIAIEKLGDKAGQVEVGFVTVDPARDTPERLNEFLANFSPSFEGLYTTDTQTLQAVTKEFGVYYESQSDSHDVNYLVAHTSTILVVRNMGLIAVIPDDATGAQIASDVDHLLAR